MRRCIFSQAGSCWVGLNIYPLEQSLRRLAGMFGIASSNREEIGVFISLLKSLRFTFDHQELVRGVWRRQAPLGAGVGIK